MVKNQNPSTEAPRKKRMSKDKLKELATYLTPSTTPTSLKSSDVSGDLNLSSLASNLFNKAPVEFLERSTLKDLAEITQNSARCLDIYLANPKNIAIQTERRESLTSINIILGDRPFIINSINEAAHDLGVTIHVLLHPVISQAGQRISLSYLETDPLSSEQLGIFEKRLRNCLGDLITVTSDFSSMLTRAETIARLLDNPHSASGFPQSERSEVASFMRYLADGGFIFLGYCEWKLNLSGELETSPFSPLGILQGNKPSPGSPLYEVKEDVARSLENNKLIAIEKLTFESPIHRRIRMNDVLVQEYAPDGKVVSVHCFIGLLTSRALKQEAASIPLIRRKLQRIIELEDAVENSYDYKNIVNIINSMPKDAALRLDIEVLREILRSVTNNRGGQETKVQIINDIGGREILLLVVMPRDHFSTSVRNKVQMHAETIFGAAPGSSQCHFDLSIQSLVMFYCSIHTTAVELPTLEAGKLEAQFIALSKTWRDNLHERILASKNFKNRQSISAKYLDAFPDSYQALQSVEDCEQDITLIETLSLDKPCQVSISYPLDAAPGMFTVIVYNLGSVITVSMALPILENAGLEVIQEKSFCVNPRAMRPVYVHHFQVRPRANISLDRAVLEKVLTPGLGQIFSQSVTNDVLNSLMLSASLDLRAISVIRAYCSLLSQVGGFPPRPSILAAVATTPQAGVRFWEMFKILFDPAQDLRQEERRIQFNTLLAAYKDSLRDVPDLTRDRLLRGLVSLLEHTVRTNFFISKDTIALKINSERVDIMPQPRPLYEIFTSSALMEGVHLRSSMVARGGIRWSDRYDDYRSEVLGLMKTQKTKNALIVPQGAKGGFVVKQLPDDPRSQGAVVEAAYKDFIRSLLSVTDNLVGGITHHPAGVIRYDGDDPYLVVAADKGTATFSDIANKIAVEEFGFWLGDAFASGGSRGYDHKVYGITAKGAWRCVERHFHDIGLNHEKNPFTVIGIGDMSGDVFGNGLLLSNNIKLIAAFNHKHIFIDPDPDPKVSFTERERLFKLKGSQWSDYSKKLISQGGAIYGRFEKEIKLSPEARKALNVGADTPAVIDSDSVISLILKAECDLLWNGGIGTYVKASSESHVDVHDGTNDPVRINADELRVRVVAEGGNLGFTQRARIDFARRGGHLNTDAIDNSAGVDLSDHEVNIKILLAGLLQNKLISFDERNELLVAMAPEVVEAVLKHNRDHALLLTLATKSSRKNMEYFQSLLRELTKHAYISRRLDALPNDDDFRERMLQRLGLFRPELSVCISAVKRWIKDALIASPLVRDELLNVFLHQYFPSILQKRFAKEIDLHPLAPHIIASQIANTLVDTFGITFLHKVCSNYGVPSLTAIQSTIAAELILDTRRLREAITAYDTCTENAVYLSTVREINKALKSTASWLVSTHGIEVSLKELVDLYKDAYHSAVKGIPDLLSGTEKELYLVRFEKYRHAQFDVSVARELALYPRIIALLQIILIVRQTKKDIRTVATVFSSLVEELGIDQILSQGGSIETNSKWENDLLLSSLDEMRINLSAIVGKLLAKNLTARADIATTLQKSISFDRLKTMIDEVRDKSPGVAAYSLLAKQLRTYRIE